jgi:dipeptidyl aminopeptidase/acylaminoacyl peptidase
MLSRIPRLVLIVALMLGASPLLRPDDSDLNRLAPVPDNQPIPVIDFLRPAIFQSPHLNSTGTDIAAIITVGNDRHLLTVYNLKTKQQQAVGGPGESDVYDIRWLDAKRLVFQLSSQKYWGMGLFAANADDLNDCYPLVQFYGTSLVSVPADDRLRPLAWNRFDASNFGKDLGVSSLNTDIQSTGKTVNVNAIMADTLEGLSAFKDAQANNERHIVDRYPQPPGTVQGYMADKDGHLAYAFADVGKWHSVYRLAGDHWVNLPIDTEKWIILSAGDDPGQLVVVGKEYTGQPHPLQFMDAATGKPGEVIIQNKSYDFLGWLYRDPVSHVMIGASSEREGPHSVWFTDAYQGLQKVLDSFFPGQVVRIVGSNDAQSLFLVGTSSDREPMVYHWVDLATKTAGLVKHSCPWIDPKRMRPMGVFPFKTRDGYDLIAYLTLPAGASKAHPAPLVVLSHGGPWLHDGWGYDGEVQLLASRGYAVLQTNYRGSTGKDWMFAHHENWDFLKMHYDVADATRAVIASGLVDPGRVAIMGGSFGAYLAVEGVVDDPTLYRCAVGISGVYDWGQFMDEKHRNKEFFGDLSFGAMMEREGDPALNKEKYDAISPARHIDRLRVPVFISHGGYDQIADIGQATHLEDELRKHNASYEKNIVATEVHGMAHLSNNVVLYDKILAFLDRNMAPLPAASH